MSFAGESKYFSNFLKPRGVNGAGDYLEVNLLPRLKGLYSDKMLKNTDLKYTSPSIDAVILSRPHMDHVGYLWNDLNDLTKNLSAASAFESSRGSASAGSSPFKVIGLKLIP